MPSANFPDILVRIQRSALSSIAGRLVGAIANRPYSGLARLKL